MIPILTWWYRRPTLAALLLIALAVIPGYWRMERLASRQEATLEDMAAFAKRLQRQEERESARLAREIEVQCRVRNATVRRERVTTEAILDRLKAVGGNARMVEDVRDEIPPIEDQEVVDCNKDGEITDADFWPQSVPTPKGGG